MQTGPQKELYPSMAIESGIESLGVAAPPVNCASVPARRARGVAHDYLEPLEMIAGSGREVIFYDQLGCGSSDQPHAPSLWPVGLFLEEIGAVREALGLSELHLFGHSCGGMLVMEYALRQPSGLRSLILASAPASIPQFIAEIQRLLTELPPDVQETIRRHEEAGTTDNQAYQEAMMVFYSRHVCRVEPLPDCLNRTFEKLMRNPEERLKQGITDAKAALNVRTISTSAGDSADLAAIFQNFQDR